MSSLERDKWQCRECSHIMLTADVLHAPNPFEPGDEMLGCPSCKLPNTVDMLCDEPGCQQLGNHGAPSGDGYRRTCFLHQPQD
jgi:hypothetical protein